MTLGLRRQTGLTAVVTRFRSFISSSPNMDQVVTGLAHIGIRIHDFERSKRFYEDLGFVHQWGPMEHDPVAGMTHPSGIELNLIINAADAETPNQLMDVDRKYPGYTHMAISVSDLKKAQELIEGLGYTLSGGPIQFTEFASGFFVRDPDGNVVEFNYQKPAEAKDEN